MVLATDLVICAAEGAAVDFATQRAGRIGSDGQDASTMEEHLARPAGQREFAECGADGYIVGGEDGEDVALAEEARHEGRPWCVVERGWLGDL